jgi:exosortase sorting signal-containing protein
MRYFISLATLVVILISTVQSNAEILIEDSDSFEIEGTDITQSVFSSGSGQPNDFILFACNTTTDGSNSFNEPVLANPNGATLNLVDFGNCQGESGCMMGIWSIFTTNPDSTDITCSWNDPKTVATAIGVRFSGVDFNDPIADYACDTGTGNQMTAPSVIAEDNSQVARIFTSSRFFDLEAEQAEEQNSVNSTIGISRSASTDTEAIVMVYVSSPVEAGPTGERITKTGDETSVWRACTVVMRGQGPSIIKPIPTLSEWGLMAMAGILGLVGFFFVARRKAISAT